MAKVNVYLSDELEAQAREADLKISAVCQDAIRAELDRISRLKGATGNLAAVAQRLLKTKEDADRKDYQDGIAAGATWASDRATFSDLDRLRFYFDNIWVLVDVTSFDTIQQFLLSRAWSLGHEEADLDWFERLRSDNAFDRGFVDGAKDVYQAVRPYLEKKPTE